jgi:excisionase family DNA binding protein
MNVAEYLSTRQAAQALGVSRSTLMGWIYGSKIAARRLDRAWLIPQAEVDRVIASRVVA